MSSAGNWFAFTNWRRNVGLQLQFPLPAPRQALQFSPRTLRGTSSSVGRSRRIDPSAFGLLTAFGFDQHGDFAS